MKTMESNFEREKLLPIFGKIKCMHYYSKFRISLFGQEKHVCDYCNYIYQLQMIDAAQNYFK